jgi:hypothetical protein
VTPVGKLAVAHLVPNSSFEIASGLPSLYNHEHPSDIVGILLNLPVPLFQLPDIENTSKFWLILNSLCSVW